MNAIPEQMQLQAMLQGIDIPPCPAILIDLDREMQKDAPDQRDIARLISRDVGLSGRLMQLANSPAFAGGRELTSIIQALSLLGNQQVFNLLVTQLLKVALAGKPDLSLERFWEASAQTARVAAELAKRLKSVRPDVAYTFGLFHDCGIPLIMKRFPEARTVLEAATAEEFASFNDIEDMHLGTNHAVVGYFLARRWRLPDFVAEGILHHHDYQAIASESTVSLQARSLIAICVMAEHIIRLHAHGEADQEWMKAAPTACAHFGLSLAAVDDLIDDMCDWLV